MRPTSHKIELDKRVAEFMASGDLYSAIAECFEYEMAQEYARETLIKISNNFKDITDYNEIRSRLVVDKLFLRVVNKYNTYEDELIEIINSLSISEEDKIKLIMLI